MSAYSDGYADGYARGQAGDPPFVEPSAIEDLHERDAAAERVQKWIATYEANSPWAVNDRTPSSYAGVPLLLSDLKVLADAYAKPYKIPEPEKPEVCEAFCWVGQSFKYCERCGHPFWEHTHDMRAAGPVPIDEETKARVKAKWD